MRVLHVTPSFYPARHCISSGFGLCSALAKIPDVEIRVLTTDSDGPNKGRRIEVENFATRFSEGFEVFYCHRVFGNDVSPSMLLRLWSMIRWADVVHLSAVYSAPTIPTLLLCKIMGKPVVWSPRGALQRWSGSTRRAVKGLWEDICNGLCDSERVLMHFTSDDEKEESLARITNATAFVVPNGVDVSEVVNAKTSGTRDRLQLLYLGRLHPIKGIENLLRAVACCPSTVHLSICGDGPESYRQSLERLVAELKLDAQVKFHGFVNGEAKERTFREADLCVVPSFKEAFCVVVAEALSRGVPVIVSSGTPWKRVATMGCGLFVDNDVATLTKAIRSVGDMPLGEMGQRGCEWMKREYSWQIVAMQMHEQYRSIIEANSVVKLSENQDRQAA